MSAKLAGGNVLSRTRSSSRIRLARGLGAALFSIGLALGLAGASSAQLVQVDWEATLEGGIAGQLQLRGSLAVLDASVAEPQAIDPDVSALVGTVVYELLPGETSEGTTFQFTSSDPGNLAGQLVGEPLRFFQFISSLALNPPATLVLGTGGPGGFCRFAVTCTTTLTFVFTPVLPDGDEDGEPDQSDNCVEIFNPDQADFDAGSDDDGSLVGIQHYGDACDADLDNDGAVGASDFFGVFRPCIGQDLSQSPECAVADFDADDVVGPSDFFGSLLPEFGRAPGPGFTE